MNQFGHTRMGDIDTDDIYTQVKIYIYIYIAEINENRKRNEKEKARVVHQVSKYIKQRDNVE